MYEYEIARGIANRRPGLLVCPEASQGLKGSLAFVYLESQGDLGRSQSMHTRIFDPPVASSKLRSSSSGFFGLSPEAYYPENLWEIACKG